MAIFDRRGLSHRLEGVSACALADVPNDCARRISDLEEAIRGVASGRNTLYENYASTLRSSTTGQLRFAILPDAFVERQIEYEWLRGPARATLRPLADLLRTQMSAVSGCSPDPSTAQGRAVRAARLMLDSYDRTGDFQLGQVSDLVSVISPELERQGQISEIVGRSAEEKMTAASEAVSSAVRQATPNIPLYIGAVIVGLLLINRLVR